MGFLKSKWSDLLWLICLVGVSGSLLTFIEGVWWAKYGLVFACFFTGNAVIMMFVRQKNNRGRHHIVFRSAKWYEDTIGPDGVNLDCDCLRWLPENQFRVETLRLIIESAKGGREVKRPELLCGVTPAEVCALYVELAEVCKCMKREMKELRDNQKDIS